MQNRRFVSLREVLNRPAKEPLPDTLKRAFDDARKALAKGAGE